MYITFSIIGNKEDSEDAKSLRNRTRRRARDAYEV